MNKKELISALAEKIGVSKKDAGTYLDSFVEIVSESLENGEEVKLVGFGTFSVSERKARKGVNPQTKKPIEIPARKVPKFRPGNELKERVK
ncbi:HU family DNA-binding protein [Oceanotoga sp. DSM 15011]|jgi:DNA-binding protein HU-beta|uniref:Nucleoid protein Hbs n=2 Tax=Petrotogaceae TaxID=1643949 RepID=A0AA45HHT0_9BACT|nr:HU family DNA-binding protein [Oceanotoga sp. DSM 15011]MDN5342975.1 DNA-binding protein HU-beta [Oceanotoga sp.]MDO7976163.1 HU family DNA-binding protein [Oceanotoga teriensis]PWJ88515.1 nucleoid protein Hbs [Oceanotoga teriensis]UYP00999.1 HU family DNA-binding protein [Oceanotoga sp. DSM 15011]